MKNKVDRIYKAALKDKTFINAIFEADKDVVPTEHDECVLFTSVYYGWLVSKYGKYWEKYV